MQFVVLVKLSAQFDEVVVGNLKIKAFEYSRLRNVTTVCFVPHVSSEYNDQKVRHVVYSARCVI